MLSTKLSQLAIADNFVHTSYTFNKKKPRSEPFLSLIKQW